MQANASSIARQFRAGSFVRFLNRAGPISVRAMDELEPLDSTYVQETLSRPPFVKISGVINVRDLGNLPSQTHKEVLRNLVICSVLQNYPVSQRKVCH
jgi:hypothetical protein